MVRGFQSFKEWFLGYEDEYTVIGGVACALLMENAGQEFRATKDLDMVLMVEALTSEFVSRFWEYIREAETYYAFLRDGKIVIDGVPAACGLSGAGWYDQTYCKRCNVFKSEIRTSNKSRFAGCTGFKRYACQQI